MDQEKSLEEEEKLILDDIASRLRAFGRERGQLIPILQMIQDRHAYIAEDAIKMAAEHLGIAICEIDLPDKDILHAKMTIRMKNGQIHEAAVNAPLGNPSKPLTMERCKEKFRKCLAQSKVDFDDGRTNELLSMIEKLEQVQDVRLLTALMQRKK